MTEVAAYTSGTELARQEIQMEEVTLLPLMGQGLT